MGRGKRKWNVGDWYWIVVDGNKVWGEIIQIDRAGYHVAWNDLSCTIVKYPVPAQGFFEGEKPFNWVLDESEE